MMSFEEKISKAILLSVHPYGREKGGVEVFSSYLLEAFPGLKFGYPNDSDRKVSFPIMKEIISCLKMGRRIEADPTFKHLDLVISNGFSGLHFALSDRPVKKVVIQHGNYAGYIRSLYPAFKLKKIYAQLTWELIERISVIRADSVVSVSESVQADLLKYYKKPSVVINNGVDTSLFAPVAQSKAREELGLTAHQKIALFVGRFTYPKGSDILLKLAEKFKDISFIFVCPGAKSENSSSLNNIYFYDAPYHIMPLFYSAANVLLAPSRFEGCSFTILEALSCNLPVISSYTGIFKSNDYNTTPGIYLVKDFTVNSYANCLSQFLSSQNTFDLRSLAIRKFSLEIMKENYLTLLSKM